jgi:hypothetical protein
MIFLCALGILYFSLTKISKTSVARHFDLLKAVFQIRDILRRIRSLGSVHWIRILLFSSLTFKSQNSFLNFFVC